MLRKTSLLAMAILLALVAFFAVRGSSGRVPFQIGALDEYIFLPFTGSYSGKPIVWLEDGLTKVLKDDPGRLQSTIALYTAKNEYEPFQIVVRAPLFRNLTGVTVTVSDFTGPGGASIGSQHVKLYREHFVYVTEGSETHRDMPNPPLGSGWYPDALIPFDDPVTGQDLEGRLDAVPFDLAAGENQPIWVDVYTPTDTPSGQYQATATVTSDQGSSEVAVTLNVWNFSLPKTRSLKAFTNFHIPPRTDAIHIELLEHRLNPRWVPRADERYLIDNFGLDMVHVYTDGGTRYNHCETDPAPPVAEVLEATANHQPELYVFTSYANEIWMCDSIFPVFMEWATNLRLGESHPMIVTYPVDELMGPDLDNTAADLWSILPKHYELAKSNIQRLVDHQTTQVWSYNPLVQEGYSPKFTIDFSPINARIMQGFVNQSLGLTGTKFWRVDNWTSEPWEKVEAYRANAPGEAHMVYPGEDVGLPGQIVSGIRMKLFRDGSEDYEYIQILEDLGYEQLALEITQSVAVDFRTWTKDKDVLYAARKALGDKIHALNPSTTAAGTGREDESADADAGSPGKAEVTVRFAVIGDYGNDSSREASVAALVDGWNPDFVLTTGDNNYPDGQASTIDENVGQYYSRFIGNYQGSYGPGSPTNRFWPSLGNHDWHTITCEGSNCDGAYFDYFTLPNNERYYEADLGLVHLFALDSDSGEPDGAEEDTVQATWLQNQLAASTSCYDIVFFHHAPYSSGRHGSRSRMQWPFSAWGADVVFNGHDHLYERLEANGIPYFVNGAGGAGLYDFENIGSLPPEATSLVRYNDQHGAMLVTASATAITYQFYNSDNILIDEFTQTKYCSDYRYTFFLPTVTAHR